VPSFITSALILFEIYWGGAQSAPPPEIQKIQKFKKSPGEIGLKCEEKCSSGEKLIIVKSCAGSKVSNGPEDFLVFTEPSRQNRQRRQHFARGKAKQLARRLSGKICADV